MCVKVSNCIMFVTQSDAITSRRIPHIIFFAILKKQKHFEYIAYLKSPPQKKKPCIVYFKAGQFLLPVHEGIYVHTVLKQD